MMKLLNVYVRAVTVIVTYSNQLATVARSNLFRTRHRLRHCRKPIAIRFQHQIATHATDVSDVVTTVTQRVTVAKSNKNFELAIVSAIAEYLYR